MAHLRSDFFALLPGVFYHPASNHDIGRKKLPTVTVNALDKEVKVNLDNASGAFGLAGPHQKATPD